MKKEKRSIKEIVEKALKDIEMKRKQKKGEIELEEKEVLIEPILMLSPEDLGLTQEEFEEKLNELCDQDDENEWIHEVGEIHDFTNLSDIMNMEIYNEDGPSVEIHEEDILADEQPQEIAEFEEKLKKLADSITALTDETMIECSVEGEERFLVSGTNCYMKQVPLLKSTMITPSNLTINEVSLNGDMQDLKEAELLLTCEAKEYEIQFKCDVNTLLQAGLLLVLEDDYLDIVGAVQFSSVAWRGMTKPVDIEELERMFKQTL